MFKLHFETHKITITIITIISAKFCHSYFKTASQPSVYQPEFAVSIKRAELALLLTPCMPEDVNEDWS